MFSAPSHPLSMPPGMALVKLSMLIFTPRKARYSDLYEGLIATASSKGSES